MKKAYYHCCRQQPPTARGTVQCCGTTTTRVRPAAVLLCGGGQLLSLLRVDRRARSPPQPPRSLPAAVQGAANPISCAPNHRAHVDVRAALHSHVHSLSPALSAICRVQAYFPHVIEPALGLNRLLMAILSDGLQQETVPTASGGTDTRTVFKVHPDLAPVKVAVLPLLKKDEQIATAEALQTALLKHCAADMDVTQSIGKRYRRQDEIGTPLCVTVDPGTAGDGAVTVRDRDSMTQVRMPLAEVTARAAAGTLTPAAIFTAGSGTVLQAAATAASASPSKQ